MRTDTFRGRDFITLLDWTKEEVEPILDVALDLKQDRAIGNLHDHLLRAKTLFMIFYNQSLRTRNSFEAGMHQMGGHAHFLDPSKIYTPALEGKEVAYCTERVSDVARVLSRMGDAIAIRCYGDPVDWEYGGANALLHEFASWSDVPILNMEDDKYHPFQALADVLTVKEKFGTFKGTKFVMSWAYSPSVHKPRAVPQSAIIGATLMGCDTVLAHPPEMELDPEVIAACEANAEMNGSSFKITDDFMGAAEGAHVLYPKAWAATPIFKPPVGEDEPERPRRSSTSTRTGRRRASTWSSATRTPSTCTACPPTAPGRSPTRSWTTPTPRAAGAQCIYDEAENRLHVQKAVMALTMR